MRTSEWSLANDVIFTCTLLSTNMDVENPWLPKEADLQTVGFPHLYKLVWPRLVVLKMPCIDSWLQWFIHQLLKVLNKHGSFQYRFFNPAGG